MTFSASLNPAFFRLDPIHDGRFDDAALLVQFHDVGRLGSDPAPIVCREHFDDPSVVSVYRSFNSLLKGGAEMMPSVHVAPFMPKT